MSDPFFTTQWTRVIAAKGETEDARLALGELCEAYYDPVVGFLRKEGRSGDEARELAEGEAQIVGHLPLRPALH